MYRPNQLVCPTVWWRAILAALICCGFADMARAAAPPAEPDLAAVVRSLATLSRGRPVFCDLPPSPAPAGWIAAPAQCVWHKRLTMRRWVLDPSSKSGCTSPQAAWWHWQQQYDPAAGSSPVWDASWRRQVLFQGGADQSSAQVVTFIAQGADSGWTVTTWRWDMPDRAATRRWEQKRWDELKQALQRSADADRTVAPRSLLGLGYRNLRNRPAERLENGLVWQANNQCMRLSVAGMARESDIPLPYVREDSRLEQRAAIQVQLARSDPSQTWPAVFHLMLPILPHQRSATYAAVSRKDMQLIGHVWLPAKNEEPQQLRIETAVAAKPGSPGEAQLVSELDRELAALAALWVADHER